MNLLRKLSAALIVLISWNSIIHAQTNYSGVLAGWTFYSLTGGRNNWGPSPYAASSNSSYVTVAGLTRGSGVSASGNAAAGGWGGYNFVSTSATAAVAANQFVTFSLTPTNGGQVSFSSISPFGYVCQSTGPTNGLLQYSIAGGPFANVTSLLYTNFTTNGFNCGPVNLSGTPGLQNVPPGTTVTFRLVNYSASSSIGVWYLFNIYDSTNLDFAIQGTFVSNAFLVAYDAGPGFFGGENLVLTNTGGLLFNVWSSPYASVSVTNWSYEGTMAEQPLPNSLSRYSINVNPSSSPMYYVIGTTNNFKFPATVPLTTMTTEDYVDFDVLNTNTPISPGGVFAIPTPAAILQPPSATNVFAGQNTSLNVVATGNPAVSYQWLENNSPLTNGGAISGVYTSQLNFSPAKTNQTGNYSVVVTNLSGSATSSLVLLDVAPLPVLVGANSTNGPTLSASNGAINSTYVVQRATNLAPSAVWLPVQTNVIGPTGQILYTGTNQNVPAGYYRIYIP